MALTMEERVRKASAQRVANAMERRFARYAKEMDDAPRMAAETQQVLAKILRDCGWQVEQDY